MRIKVTENDVKKVIKDYLNIKRIFHWYNLQGLGSFRGIPDFVAVYKGRVICIETKSPTGVQSKWQKLFQANVENSDGIYILARGLEDVEKVIEEIGSGK